MFTRGQDNSGYMKHQHNGKKPSALMFKILLSSVTLGKAGISMKPTLKMTTKVSFKRVLLMATTFLIILDGQYVLQAAPLNVFVDFS